MPPARPRQLSRRAFLAAGAALIGAACSDSGGDDTSAPPSSSTAASSTPPEPASAAPAPSGPARFVSSGPTDSRQVALTFHVDGDLELAAELLDVLATRDTSITAFVVGEWLDANPDWAARLTDAGHELANHTYTHPTFGDLDDAAMTDEIVRCRDVLVRLTGSGGRFFRTSGTADGTTPPAEVVLELAGTAGYPIVLGFDVDPLDYQDPGVETVAARTLDAVQPGSVISLHFDHPETVVALPPILDGLEERGLTPVTASQLLSTG